MKSRNKIQTPWESKKTILGGLVLVIILALLFIVIYPVGKFDLLEQTTINDKQKPTVLPLQKTQPTLPFDAEYLGQNLQDPYLISSFILPSFGIVSAQSDPKNQSKNLTYRKEKLIPQGLDKLETEKPKYKGYIVEFKNSPVIEYKTNLENQLKEQKLKSKQQSKFTAAETSQINSQIASYRSQIEAEHSNAKNDIISALKTTKSDFDKKLMNEFKNTFNGIALDISDDEAKNLEKSAFVKKVYPNYEVHAFLNESVPLIGADQVWQMDANGNDCSTNPSTCLTGKGIKIAIIDTGVDYTHPDLGGGKVIQQDCYCSEYPGWRGSCCPNGQNEQHDQGAAMDDMGHGTHVAATAAGKGDYNNNNVWDRDTELWGVAPDASIHAIKVLDASGSGLNSDIVAGIDKAVDPNGDGDFSDHDDIISMSLGNKCRWYDEYCGPDDPVSQAADAAVDAGTVVTIAAGNDGPEYGTVASPGTSRKAITVGATDKTDRTAWFSSSGPIIWNKKTILKPDIVAPGISICAAQWNNAWAGSQCFDDKHIAISGTSMATPHVAGATALLKQAHPDWTPYEIKSILLIGSKSLEYSIFTQGYGRIRINESISMKKPSVAILNIPEIGEGIINITGSSYGDGFLRYSIEYTYVDVDELSTFPYTWTFLTSSAISVSNSNLYENFDTRILKDGYYIFKLNTYTSDESNNTALSLLFISNNKTYTCSSIDKCRLLFHISNSYIELKNNILSYDALGIVYDNITLNCNNYGIAFVNSYADYGVLYIKGKNSQILNCSIPRCSGIIDTSRSNTRLINNNLTCGVFLYESNDAILKNNKIKPRIGGGPNGIFLKKAMNTSIVNNDINDVDYGIVLDMSKLTTLRENKIYPTLTYDSRGLYLSGNSCEYMNHLIGETNKISDWPIYYYFNMSNIMIENKTNSSIYLTCSFNATIRYNKFLDKNEFFRNDGGIIIHYSNNSRIYNNNFSGLLYNNIAIYNSSNIDISNNSIDKSNEAVYLKENSGIDIHDNLVNNSIYSITLLNSSEIKILNNILQNNYYAIDILRCAKAFIENNSFINNHLGFADVISSYDTILACDYLGFTITNNYFYDNSYPLYLSSTDTQRFPASYNNLKFYNNAIMIRKPITSHSFDYNPLHYNLSVNNKGNFWGRSEYPYFCEYGNQNTTCIDNWDSMGRYIIDPCPYNQSYPPGQWPVSPMCPKYCYYNKSIQFVTNPSLEVDSGINYGWGDAVAGNNFPDGWGYGAVPAGKRVLDMNGKIGKAIKLTGDTNQNYIIQDIPVEFNKTYEVSGWIRTELTGGTGKGMILSQCVDTNHNLDWGADCGLRVDPMIYLRGTTNWTYVNFIVNAIKANRMLRIACINDAGNIGNIWCDEFSVKETPIVKPPNTCISKGYLPYYCDSSANIVPRCQTCGGCASGYSCTSSGTCLPKQAKPPPVAIG